MLRCVEIKRLSRLPRSVPSGRLNPIQRWYKLYGGPDGKTYVSPPPSKCSTSLSELVTLSAQAYTSEVLTLLLFTLATPP